MAAATRVVASAEWVPGRGVQGAMTMATNWV